MLGERRWLPGLVAVLLAGACSRTSAPPPPAAAHASRNPVPVAEAPPAPSSNAIADRIPAPPGCARVEAEAGSFAAWLRRLPLKAGRPPVRLYNGELKANQEAHAAVLDLDIGRKNLLQCADAVICLRAEYLYAQGRHEDIRFHFTSGERADFSRWAQGLRPQIEGSHVTWNRTGTPGTTEENFRSYLETVYTYAGTLSLSRELAPVASPEDLRIGDVFIHGGSPGHAVLVVDAARRACDGALLFLLVQGYMPAQEMHLLVNPNDPSLSPWYRAGTGNELTTPEWIFSWNDLRRFP